MWRDHTAHPFEFPQAKPLVQVFLEVKDPSALDKLGLIASTAHHDEDAPADRWLLKDCLPMGVVGLIVGPGGVGKSRFICQLLISVATGATFAAWEIGEPGSMLAFFAEDDRKELHKRFKRAFKARDLDPETKEVIRGTTWRCQHDTA